jgi:catechol 2,3-dioxygenase-like lactoylglutathione lyase family enzyme
LPAVTPKILDHVALWVADRDRIANFLTEQLGMHVIERTDRFTLVGADARRGKVTLFAAEGPRERGALKHIALRVNDGDEAVHEVGEGLVVKVVRAETDVDYDLDHVALYSAAPEDTAQEYLRLGFDEAAPRDGLPRVEVGGAYVEFHPGRSEDGGKPLLNHLAVLVDSADEHISEAEELGVEIADVVDAPNTYAVFLWGPERVKIEYVEHKPTFSLT